MSDHEKENSNLISQQNHNNLTSPEQLDRLVNVVGPKYWLALLAIATITASFITWCFLGSIPERVPGFAMLIKPEGIVNITANATGRVVDLYIEAGNKIKAGEVVAEIEQQDLDEQIFNMWALKKEMKDRDEKVTNFQNQINDNVKKINDEWQKILANKEQLIKSGKLTAADIINTQIKVDEFTKQTKDFELDNLTSKEAMQANERKLKILLDRYDFNSKVSSFYSGVVTEVKVNQGDIVQASTPIATLEPESHGNQQLKVVIFVSGVVGKKIKPGMGVLISPGIVNKEEYGSLVGKVTNVSLYPVSMEAMLKILQNQKLAEEIIKNGVVYEVNASLTPDKKTTSGYSWTSSSGPEIQLLSGTLGTAEITVDRRRPITLILPTLEKLVGF